MGRTTAPTTSRETLEFGKFGQRSQRALWTPFWLATSMLTLLGCGVRIDLPDATIRCGPGNECPEELICVPSQGEMRCCSNESCSGGATTDARQPDATHDGAAEDAPEAQDAPEPKDGPQGEQPEPSSGSPDASAPEAAAPADAPCPATCVPGTKRCGPASGLQVCEDRGGCSEWSAETPCPASRTCQGDAVSAACTCPAPPASCVNGSGTFCGSPTEVATCVMDAQGCIARGETRPCPAGKPCTGTHPSASCSCPPPPPACSAGAGTACQGNSLVTCGLDTNGCLVASAMSVCPAGKPCAGAYPSASCTCPPGPAGCNGQTSGTFCSSPSSTSTCALDANGCVVVSGMADCPPGNSCAGTAPSAVCRKITGQSCTAGAECVSSVCRDGVCCGTSCDGACQACNFPGMAGMCAAVADGADADTCSAENRMCNLAGQCVKIDQQQLLRGIGGSLGGTYEQKVAQVVTAGTAGSLVEVRIAVSCTPGSAITVEIQGVTGAGAPDGNVLSSRSFQPGMLPEDGQTLRAIPLTIPVSLAVGTHFAIIVQGPQTNSCGIRFGPNGETYTGGKSFYDTRPNLPGWVENTNDLPFETLVQ